MAAITPVLFACCVDAIGPQARVSGPPSRTAAVVPAAAVIDIGSDQDGPAVVAVSQPPSSFHVVVDSTGISPSTRMNSSGALAVPDIAGGLGIPAIALSAYRRAERQMDVVAPECGIRWTLLAGIGRIESNHAGNGSTNADGTMLWPIYGPPLDGSLPGNEIVVQSTTADKVIYARAIGPMQFLPGTWARYASDGNGDGLTDPQNLYDAALAAAHYLCSGGLNLHNQSQVLRAVLRYNNSMTYARNVLGWATAYVDGVIPTDLPPITQVPLISKAHLAHPEGLGPGLPADMNGLSATEPLIQIPSIDLDPVPPPPDDPPAEPREAVSPEP